MMTSIPPSLLSPEPPFPSSPLASTGAVAIAPPRQRHADLDRDALIEQVQGLVPQGQLTLALFQDVIYTFNTGYVETAPDGALFWRGAVLGLPDVQAHLAVTGTNGGAWALSGLVQVGALLYTLNSTTESQVHLREVPPGSLMAAAECVCRTDTPPEVYDSEIARERRATLAQEYQAAQTLLNTDTMATIRVVMLYPPQTRTAAGGRRCSQS